MIPEGIFFIRRWCYLIFFSTSCVVTAAQHKAHPCSAASVSHFCLQCLASLHQQSQREPSITSLPNIHTASTHHWKPATTAWPWNGNMVRTRVFAAFPWHLLTFPPQLCVCIRLWGTDFSEKKWKGMLDRKRDQRVSVEARLTAGQSPSTISQPTQQLDGLQKKSTHRSHYCPPSSVFTGMLKIVITSVRTEISNLDVFTEGLWPSSGEGRQSQRETDSGTEEEV